MPDDAARLTIGGNNAPLAEALADETAAIIARRDELLASAGRAPASIDDEEMAGKVADLVRLLAACHKNAEAQRVSTKEPHLEAGRLVDAVYKKITEPLEKAKRGLESLLTVFQRRKAEEERRRREEAARLAEAEAARQRKEAADLEATMATETDLGEAVSAVDLAQQAAADAAAAARSAQAKPAELSRSRGDLGAVASLKTFWDFADLDRATIDLEALRGFLPFEALERGVRAYVKANFASGHPGAQLKGCRIFENTTTAVR